MDMLPKEISILWAGFLTLVSIVITWLAASHHYRKAAKDAERHYRQSANDLKDEAANLRLQTAQIMRYLVERDRGSPPETEVTADNEIRHNRTLKPKVGEYKITGHDAALTHNKNEASTSDECIEGLEAKGEVG